MGLIDRKLAEAVKPGMDRIEEMIRKEQAANKELMLKKVEEMLQTIDEIIEQKINERFARDHLN